MTRVELYTSRYCPYCNAAKALMRRKGVQFNEIDISGNCEKRDEMIQRSGGRLTIPQIFIDNLHLGGAAELEELERTHELDRLLTRESGYRGSRNR